MYFNRTNTLSLVKNCQKRLSTEEFGKHSLLIQSHQQYAKPLFEELFSLLQLLMEQAPSNERRFSKVFLPISQQSEGPPCANCGSFNSEQISCVGTEEQALYTHTVTGKNPNLFLFLSTNTSLNLFPNSLFNNQIHNTQSFSIFHVKINPKNIWASFCLTLTCCF